MAKKRKIEVAVGLQAVRELCELQVADELLVTAPPAQVALATRFLLEELATLAPGRSVEVRVPPWGAVQCLAGTTHTRGTPPNVIETTAEVWLRLATGQLSWEQAIATGAATASGNRANLSGLLPLVRLAEVGEK